MCLYISVPHASPLNLPKKGCICAPALAVPRCTKRSMPARRRSRSALKSRSSATTSIGTVGRELAARLDVPFFDLDDLVEAAEKTTIKEIFAQHGEPYFRKRERDILRSTHHLDGAVVATGGGTFTFDENIQFIQAEGLSVWL